MMKKINRNICHIYCSKLNFIYISEFCIILLCGRVITVGPHRAL